MIYLLMLFAGIIVGAIGMGAWAIRHAPLMEDEPSFLDKTDWGDDERADGDDAQR